MSIDFWQLRTSPCSFSSRSPSLLLQDHQREQRLLFLINLFEIDVILHNFNSPLELFSSQTKGENVHIHGYLDENESSWKHTGPAIDSERTNKSLEVGRFTQGLRVAMHICAFHIKVKHRFVPSGQMKYAFAIYRTSQLYNILTQAGLNDPIVTLPEVEEQTMSARRSVKNTWISKRKKLINSSLCSVLKVVLHNWNHGKHFTSSDASALCDSNENKAAVARTQVFSVTRWLS